MFTNACTLQQPSVTRKGQFYIASNSFGSRLLEARLAYAVRRGRTVSQSELARLIGVTPQAWSGWEQGLSEPLELSMIQRIAQLLGVTPGWLAFGQFPIAAIEQAEPVSDSYGEMVPEPPASRKRRAK